MDALPAPAWRKTSPKLPSSVARILSTGVGQPNKLPSASVEGPTWQKGEKADPLGAPWALSGQSWTHELLQCSSKDLQRPGEQTLEDQEKGADFFYSQANRSKTNSPQRRPSGGLQEGNRAPESAAPPGSSCAVS